MMTETNPVTALPDRLIPATGDEITKLTMFSARHCKRLEAAGKFPRRVNPGGFKSGWRLSEVMAWLDALPRHDAETARKINAA